MGGLTQKVDWNLYICYPSSIPVVSVRTGVFQLTSKAYFSPWALFQFTRGGLESECLLSECFAWGLYIENPLESEYVWNLNMWYLHSWNGGSLIENPLESE